MAGRAALKAPKLGIGDGPVEQAVRRLVTEPLPLPGRGDTRARWATLADWGRGDLSVARLAEGHVDALAILAEAGLEAEPGALYGVWASRAGGRRSRVATRGGRSTLSGIVPFCSAAGLCDRALVVAEPDGPPEPEGTPSLLVEVMARGRGRRVRPGSWTTESMANSVTRDVEFDDVAVERVVGEPGWYTSRPGFAHGGGGVAAVWWGGAAELAERARSRLTGASPDAHQLAHLGELHALLAGAHALLQRTADRIDGEAAPLMIEINLVRAMVERAARETVERLPRVLGPGPLTTDRGLATRLADLGLYLRQHHGERDHAALGAHLVGRR